MQSRRIRRCVRLLCLLAWLACCASPAAASEYHGQVTFGGLPVPGATVTATRADQKYSTITDQQGFYSFGDLPDGAWNIEIQMTGFATVRQDVTIVANMPAASWPLKLLPIGQINAVAASSVAPAPAPSSAAAAPSAAPHSSDKPPKPRDVATGETQQAAAPEIDQRAADGLLINGSVNNGASSPFAQMPVFGNGRRGGRGLYNGAIGISLNNSALDASQYSLTGFSTPRPGYNQITGEVTFGGPLRIPHLWRNGPLFFVGYTWSRNGQATTESARVPTDLERAGNLSQSFAQPTQIYNPATGLAFAGNMVPVSFQAQQLLKLYPEPNLAGNPIYNYQVPIVTNTHSDALNLRLSKGINAKNQVYGLFAVRSTRGSNPNLFDFVDKNTSLGLNTSLNWRHQFAPRLFQTFGVQFSRQATEITPYWANRENISGEAQITGNNQDALNWGPPALNFSSGIASLSDGQSSHNRNQTAGVSDSLSWFHGSHYFTFGGDFRRQEFNYFSQQDPRGAFSFTGAATQQIVNGAPVSGAGSDLADFLLGIPDTSSIAFGNPDKYLRESVYDAFFNDDWRLAPQFTISAGLRWEYGAPITELRGRLVNLDVAPGFSAVAPVLASDPIGSLTGRRYPDSLVEPDKHGIEPRIGIAWRPLSGSSMVVRAGYGIYYDTSVYQAIAAQMMQQAPLSTSLSVQNSPACPLTLANGFGACPAITPNTFAIDPDFRIGYAQTWQLAIQRDLPAALQMTATYLGAKGTHGLQEFLPNTFPAGAMNPCPSCPAGFAFLTSGGNSTRESGQLQLRRRLRNGLTASAAYTFSKSIDDDAAVGGQIAGLPTPAQNWLDLRAERALSSFDQRHLLSTQLQYTTGMGLRGGTLLGGWRGLLFKEWTFLTNVNVGSGLPETPVYPAAVSGTGMTNVLRPDRTSAPLYAGTQAGAYLNPAAFVAPRPGQWGNAGRDSITGPSQFSMDASLARSFHLKDRMSLDFELSSTNILNHVTFSSYNAIFNNTQFGLPVAPNQMRSIQTLLRLGF